MVALCTLGEIPSYASQDSGLTCQGLIMMAACHNVETYVAAQVGVPSIPVSFC